MPVAPGRKPANRDPAITTPSASRRYQREPICRSIPYVIESTGREERVVRHLQPAAEGPHHLPARGGPRRDGQRHRRPAAAPAVRGPEGRHPHVHQQPRRQRDGRAWPSTTRCSSSPAPWRTYCIGMAASMGAVLLTAGATGKRFALPNAEIMIHQPLGGYEGTATDIDIHVKNIKKIEAPAERHPQEAHRQDARPDREGHRPRQLHDRRGSPRLRPDRRGARADADADLSSTLHGCTTRQR